MMWWNIAFPQQWFKDGKRYMQIYQKLHSITGIFLRIPSQVQNSDIEKCILMAASKGKFIWKYSWKSASQRQLQTYIHFRNLYTYFTFLTWTWCKKGANFHDFFFSKGFGARCKDTVLALNFIQKQYFNEKKHISLSF